MTITKIKATALFFISALIFTHSAKGQEYRKIEPVTTDTTLTYTQPFAIDKDVVVTSTQLSEFSQEVDSIMRTDTITHVSITGLASIDGPESLNKRLARSRALAMEKYLMETTSIPEGVITTAWKGEDWKLFRQLVSEDPQIPMQKRVLQIIDSKMSLTAKEGGIKGLDNGNTWQYLAKHIFPMMRCAEVVLNVKHRFIVPIPEEIIEVEEVDEIVEEVPVVIEPEEPEVVVAETVEEVIEECRRNFYIKTDLPYWLMSWSNLAFEIDMAPHWSFNLPIYFSAVNYFKRNIKFRTFSFQPGVRYWLNGCNTGVYLEAHYGMGWWNFAFGGEYRYQDHFRKSPTMGGGIGAGYRLPVSKNGRWTMEFGGGVGVYRLDYDRFQNRPNGKLIDSHKKTVFFIDNVNVSISYSIPVEKKGGKK